MIDEIYIENDSMENDSIENNSIEEQDAKIGAKRSKLRSSIEDIQMRQELKELDLTCEEMEDIFGY